jgi:tRNA pseudouridine13 synthase
MRESHPIEAAVGIAYYVSEADGVGGHLRDRPEDFRVREREAFGADVHSLDAETGSYPHLVFRATLRGWDTNDFASACRTNSESAASECRGPARRTNTRSRPNCFR